VRRRDESDVTLSVDEVIHGTMGKVEGKERVPGRGTGSEGEGRTHCCLQQMRAVVHSAQRRQRSIHSVTHVRDPALRAKLPVSVCVTDASIKHSSFYTCDEHVMQRYAG
jgi:hypothetical protein